MTEFSRYNSNHEPRTTNHEPRTTLFCPKRIEYIDTFRALGIILMIMGHVGFGYKFDYFIHAFHMPMFFVVSGIFFKPSGFRNFSGKKAQTLLLPYVYFGTLHYLLWVLKAVRKWPHTGIFDECSSMLLHLVTVNTEGLIYAGALWFLTALFFTEIIYYAVFNLVRNPRIRDIVIIILSCMGCLASYILPFTLWYALSASFAGLGLYHAGYVCRKYIDSFNLSFTKTLILGIITTALIFLNGYVNMRAGVYSFIPLFYLNALLACIAGISTAKILRSILPVKADEFLQRIGRNSIIYLCLNQIVIWLVSKIIPPATFTERLAVLFIALAILFIGERIITCTKLDILTGKNHQAKHCVVLGGILTVIAGLVFTATLSARQTNRNPSVRLPDWDNINTTPLSPEEYYDAEALKSLIAVNLKYILNTQWNSEQTYAFSHSTATVKYVPLISEKIKTSRSTESFRNWRTEQYLDIANAVSGYRENALRPWGHACFVLAGALKFNLYDENITGIPKDDAVNMLCKLIVSLARLHASNRIDGWGMNWQSALWSENIAFAGWLMWEKLSQEGRKYVADMVLYEADRLADYDVPYYMNSEGTIMFDNDTKAEENAWNSRILALASCMFPDDINRNIWEAKMRELLLSAVAAPEDTYSQQKLDGHELREILKGSNINSDGTLINHGLYHIDYMACAIEGMTDTSIIYKLSGKNIPESAYFNHNKIYSALVNVDLGKYESDKTGHHFYERTEKGVASSEVNMPGKNDWGGKWYASYYLADTEAELLTLDNDCPEGLKASDWAHIHLLELQRMIDRQNTGQIFTEGENYFVSGETYMMHNLMKAYMFRRLNL